MHSRALVFLLLFFPLSLGAEPLQNFLNQTAVPLSQETSEKTRIVFYLERPQVRGQLARWDRKKSRFYLSKTALKNWLKRTQAPTPELLARCLAPLYEHEKFHAQNDYLAEQNGFIWPLTLGDEILATAKQVAFMREREKNQPDYYKNCHFLTPALSAERKATEQQNWTAFEDSVLARYAHLPAQKLPPPPITPEFIRQAQTGKITYGPLMYKVRGKGANLQKVFSSGRPWTEVNTKQLYKIANLPFFKIYLKIFTDQTNQIKRELFRR